MTTQRNSAKVKEDKQEIWVLMKKQILKTDVGKGFLKETFPWTRSLGTGCRHQQLLAVVENRAPDRADLLPFHPKTLWKASGNQKVPEMLKTRQDVKP